MRFNQAPIYFPERTMSLVMHFAGLIPCLYFSMFHIFYGIFWYGLSILPCLVAIQVSVFWMFSQPDSQRYKEADFWFLILAIPPVLLGLVQDSTYGEFLVPPLILACFIHLPLKLAERLVFVVSLTAIALSFWHLGSHLAIRFSLGLLASHIFAWGLARVVMKQNTDLKQLAFKDSLTGCYNRRALYDELLKAKQLYTRSHVISTIILLDIDYFKQINDQHGHNTGDQVLIWFAEFLQQHIRVNDRVFRFGGEEFLIILQDADFTQGYDISEKLLQQLNQMLAPHQQALSFSAGVASILTAESIDDWLDRADQAMYCSKQAGRKQTWPEHIKKTNAP